MNLFEAFPRLFLCLTLLCVAISGSVYSSKHKRTSKFVFKDGDVIIGGLSPVHFSSLDMEGQDDEFTCQGEFNTRGFEAVEAMLFTMDMLNEGALKDRVLPNITVGMDIKETCTSADSAVRESLNFSFIRNANMQGKCSADNPLKSRETKTVAVVGAAYSGVSMAVTNLCGLFYVPLVSYASTSRLLSNKVQFRYFLRTVPNDMLQAQVMADLVRSMNWNYVITLASDTEYGRSGIEAFKQAAQSFDDYDICIPVDETFTKRSDQKTFKRIFRLMRENPKAKVVILFAELHDAKILIDKTREQGINEKYIWIGSDAWADSKQVLKGNEAILNGMFAIVPEVRKIWEFMEYFVNFNDKRRQRNPWMTEYEDKKVAYDPAFHRQTFVHYPKAPYVMDAVLATAYALHNLLGCEPYKDCSSLLKSKISSPQFQKDFVDYLKKVSFPGMSRDTMYFDDSGDAIGIYDIRHLKLVGENYDFFRIGRWGSAGNCEINEGNSSSSCLELHKDQIDQSIMNATWEGIPFSRCSQTCPAGSHKVSELDHAKCCWTCRQCSGSTVSNATDRDVCFTCPRGFWANVDHSKCEPIKPTFLRWFDPPALVICISMGLGSVVVVCAFIVFFLYRETPVVKASSRELCYVLLLGIGWCFVVPVFYLLEPTDMVCRAIPFATGLCPSLIVGTLLTKTNRISRIFNRKLSKAGAPVCLSKKWQLLMVVCITLVEIFICVICIYFSNTGRNIVTFDSRNEVIIECKSLPDIWVAIWWAYIVGLVATCTYQAFLTRKLPENYNEAKFITFTMLITCIVVIMYIPTYIGTSGIYRTVVTSFVFIIGGWTAFGCIFVPKLYIILWRPEKNVPMQPRTQPIRLGIISPSSSFVGRLSVDHNATPDATRTSHKQRNNSMPFIVDVESQKEIEELRKRTASRSMSSLSIDILKRGNDFSDVDDGSQEGMKKQKILYKPPNQSMLYHSEIDKIDESNEQSKSDCELINKTLGGTRPDYLPLIRRFRSRDYVELPTTELGDSRKITKSDSKVNGSESNDGSGESDYSAAKNGDVHRLSKYSSLLNDVAMDGCPSIRNSTTFTSETDSTVPCFEDRSELKDLDLFAPQNNSFTGGQCESNNSWGYTCACREDLKDDLLNQNEPQSKQGALWNGENRNSELFENHFDAKAIDALQNEDDNDSGSPRQNRCKDLKNRGADSYLNHVKRPPSDGLITARRLARGSLNASRLSKSLSCPANELLRTCKNHSHDCNNKDSSAKKL